MRSNIKLINLQKKILYLMFFTISIITIMLIAADNDMEQGYNLLWLLPLSFIIVSIIAINVTKSIYKNIIVAIIWGGYFVQFVLTPLFLTLGNYRIIFSSTVTPTNIKKATWLMVYELFIAFFILEIYLVIVQNKYMKGGNLKNNHDSIIVGKKTDRIVHFALFLLVLLCISIIIYIPQIINSYTWIFADNKEITTIGYNIADIALRGTIKRALGSLFIFVLNIVRYLVPVYLLRRIYIKFGNSHLGYILSLLVCFIPFLVINESNIQPFLGLIFNVIMMERLYPHKRKSILKFFITTGGLLVLSIFASKLFLLGNWQETRGMESLSLSINAYFPGIGNVAASYNIIDNCRLDTFFYDLFSTIPFRNSIFPQMASKSTTLTHLFNQYNGTLGNIIPCISGAKHYLGSVFAPILPAFLSCLAVKLKMRADLSDNYWHYFYFMFFSIRVAMIPILYNHMSFIHILINQIIPMYFMTVFITGRESN